MQNFVDNGEIDKSVTFNSVSTPGLIQKVYVTVDFHSIDGEDPMNPGPGLSYSNEVYMKVTSPA